MKKGYSPANKALLVWVMPALFAFPMTATGADRVVLSELFGRET